MYLFLYAISEENLKGAIYMAELWVSFDIDDSMSLNQLEYYQTLMKQKTNADWKDKNDFHVTIDYVGEDESGAEQVVEAMKILERNLDKSMFNQYLFGNKINHFGNTLWIGVDNSFKLYRIHYALEEIFKMIGYQKPESKFNGYTPHITMASNADDIELDMPMRKVPIPFTNITLWNSFKVNGQYVDNFLYRIDLIK